MNWLNDMKVISGNGLNSEDAATVGKKMRPSRIHNGHDKQ